MRYAWLVSPRVIGWLVSLGVIALTCNGCGGCGRSGKEEIIANAPETGEKNAAYQYEKPEGVVFHIPAILGMKLSQFEGSEREVYLGSRLEEVKLPGIRGRLVKYGQGELYVARDIIYAMAYEFPRPVSRLEAIHLCGLPESLNAELKPSSTVLRVERSSYGFRRLVLTRVEPNKDLFTRIEAWKFLPQERF